MSWSGDPAGSRVLVVGLGISGCAVANKLIDLHAKVTVVDQASSDELEARARTLTARGAEVHLAAETIDGYSGDVAVLSPGVPPSAPIVEWLRSAFVPVISEIELGYRLARCDLLAVTGTNGKTTATTLLAAMLAEGGIRSAAAGNIGTPLVEAIDAVPPDGAIAVEVSSFQLATIESFRPRIAVVLNIAEDHTDWHGSVEGYVAAKGRIVENQLADDVLVINADDDRVQAIAEAAPSRVVSFSTRNAPDGGIGVAGRDVVWRDDRVFSLDDLPIATVALIEDAIGAAGAALEYGVNPGAVRRAVGAFSPLPHRLQVVATLDGVTFIDDSKATNPHATIAAVRGLRDVVLIAGGRAKGVDLTPLSGAVPPVIEVIAIGEAATEVEDAFAGRAPTTRVASMEAAVSEAAARAVRGGSVLLSPACASLDMYESYAARGDDFAAHVRNLARAGRSWRARGNS